MLPDIRDKLVSNDKLPCIPSFPHPSPRDLNDQIGPDFHINSDSTRAGTGFMCFFCPSAKYLYTVVVSRRKEEINMFPYGFIHNNARQSGHSPVLFPHTSASALHFTDGEQPANVSISNPNPETHINFIHP